MNVISIIMAGFAILGIIDRIFGSKLGLGKEFEKGFLLLGQIALSMIGMIIVAPIIADILSPFFDFVYTSLKIEPSIIPATIFANDMGGAPLAKEIAQNSKVGMYNAMVVSSMMGATISFTIPFALGCLKKAKQKEFIIGLLCGIVTIPVGCIVSGIYCKIPIVSLLLNLMPLIILAVIIAIGLLLVPNICIKVFGVLGVIIKIIISIGLTLGIIELLIGKKLIGTAADISEAGFICLNAAVVMSGAFPLLFVISKLLSKPMGALGNAVKINKKSTLGFISTLANNVTTFEMMNEMDSKGAVLNSAFAVSASFVLADHLAFTLSYEPSYLFPMMIAKIVSGLAAIFFAVFVYKKTAKSLCGNEN